MGALIPIWLDVTRRVDRRVKGRGREAPADAIPSPNSQVRVEGDERNIRKLNYSRALSSEYKSIGTSL